MKKTRMAIQGHPEVIQKVCELWADNVKDKVDGLNNPVTHKAGEVARLIGCGRITVVRILKGWQMANNTTEDWELVHDNYVKIRKEEDGRCDVRTKTLVEHDKPQFRLNGNGSDSDSYPDGSPKPTMEEFINTSLDPSDPDETEHILVPNSKHFYLRAKHSGDRTYQEDHKDNVGVVMPYDDWNKIVKLVNVLLDDRRETTRKGMIDKTSLELVDLILPYIMLDTETGEWDAFYNLRTEVDIKTGQYYFGDLIECEYEERVVELDDIDGTIKEEEIV